jgi:uncharacterized repeat protein (TIGR03803 family)
MKLISVSCVLFLAGTACSRLATPNAMPAAPAGATAAATRDAVTYKTIFTFDGTDGAGPAAPLIALKGELYGTTSDGGTSVCGVVFSPSTTGKEKVLHYFDSDGCSPLGLTYAKKVLYGIANRGGDHADGTVFKMKTNGDIVWATSLGSSADGANPEGNAIYYKRAIYGTASAGGNACGGDGCGTVFEVKKGQEHTLYNFKGEGHSVYDGTTPTAGSLKSAITMRCSQIETLERNCR